MNLIDEAYTDVSLKKAARIAGPGCVKKANERANGKQNTLSERKQIIWNKNATELAFITAISQVNTTYHWRKIIFIKAKVAQLTKTNCAF